MRPAAAIVAVCALLASSGCGSSAKHAAGTERTTTPATTSTAAKTTARTTTQSTTRALTPTAAPQPTVTGPPPPTTVASSPTSTTTPELTGTQSSVVQQSICPSEQKPGIAANFGFRRTRADGLRLVRKAREFGFQNLVVQKRTCNSYAVVLTGLKNVRQAHDLEDEARSVGLRVALECRSHPIRGGLAAVFGHRKTRRAAVALKQEAQSNGFLNLQIQQDRCGDWEVDLYGIQTPDARAELKKEAASVGYHIRFESG